MLALKSLVRPCVMEECDYELWKTLKSSIQSIWVSAGRLRHTIQQFLSHKGYYLNFEFYIIVELYYFSHIKISLALLHFSIILFTVFFIFFSLFFFLSLFFILLSHLWQEYLLKRSNFWKSLIVITLEGSIY